MIIMIIKQVNFFNKKFKHVLGQSVCWKIMLKTELAAAEVVSVWSYLYN